MNNKLLQWIRANLLGIFGCMYLPKKNAKYNLIVCDVSFLIIYIVVAITTVIFFTTIICHSNIHSLEKMCEAERFWWSLYNCTNICVIFYFVINIFRWIFNSENKYSYDDISGYKVTENFYCAPFISYKKFMQYYNENERRNKAKQNALNKRAEEDLQSNINKLIYKLSK